MIFPYYQSVPWYLVTMGELTGSFCTSRICTRYWPCRSYQKIGQYTSTLKLSGNPKSITALQKTRLQEVSEKHFSWHNGAELEVTVDTTGSQTRFCKWTTARKVWIIFRCEHHTKFLTHWSLPLCTGGSDHWQQQHLYKELEWNI